jgi:ribosomal protein L13E
MSTLKIRHKETIDKEAKKIKQQKRKEKEDKSAKIVAQPLTTLKRPTQKLVNKHAKTNFNFV